MSRNRKKRAVQPAAPKAEDPKPETKPSAFLDGLAVLIVMPIILALVVGVGGFLVCVPGMLLALLSEACGFENAHVIVDNGSFWPVAWYFLWHGIVACGIIAAVVWAFCRLEQQEQREKAKRKGGDSNP